MKRRTRFIRTGMVWVSRVFILVVRIEPQAIEKFFGAAVFQKCCRGVGEQPTFAEQIKLYSEMKQKSKREPKESQLPLKIKGCNDRIRFQGQLQHAGRQKQGWNPPLPDGKDRFP